MAKIKASVGARFGNNLQNVNVLSLLDVIVLCKKVPTTDYTTELYYNFLVQINLLKY